MTTKEQKAGDGWAKVGIQIPSGMAEEIKGLASEAGAGGSRTLYTVAVAMLIGMSSEHRDALCRWVIQKGWKSPNAVLPDEVYAFFEYMMDSASSSPPDDAQSPTWYIDRILDPELTPEPGRKQSDRKKRAGGKGG